LSRREAESVRLRHGRVSGEVGSCESKLRLKIGSEAAGDGDPWWLDDTGTGGISAENASCESEKRLKIGREAAGDGDPWWLDDTGTGGAKTGSDARRHSYPSCTENIKRGTSVGVEGTLLL